jgi:excisionase family DNA binding protein
VAVNKFLGGMLLGMNSLTDPFRDLLIATLNQPDVIKHLLTLTNRCDSAPAPAHVYETIEEFATTTRLCTRTIRRMIGKGMPALQAGSRLWRIPKEEALAWLQAGHARATPRRSPRRPKEAA